MPTYWIQIENHQWDTAPNDIDRMTGQTIKQLLNKDVKTGVTRVSPVTGHSNTTDMFLPLGQDALILRRYTANWAAPMDHKVNPWDLNEPDPTDTGTMGTIPGPVIECSVGESVTVHFRNMDTRTQMGTTEVCFDLPLFGRICFPVPAPVPLPVEQRTHSLHPHGFVFAPESDGAYPLSPPDLSQPIPATEAAAWASLGVTGFKQGDRVPPGGTFTYTWNTLGWPSTSGVWLYHDHSICDEDNVGQGAIGIAVIHNPGDPQDVDIRRVPHDDDNTLDPALLPGGDPNGSPIETICFPIPFDIPALPHDRLGLPSPSAQASEEVAGHERAAEVGPPARERLVTRAAAQLELDPELKRFRRFCLSFYRTPPAKAQYLQLFHTLGDAGMCINGRKYIGNTPTMVARARSGDQPGTKMRFGVVGMGGDVSFHTFHIHGHRWVVAGPDGTDLLTIQNSPQIRAVSQFEDTRILGPANSFGFTIDEDSGIPSFMRAEPAVGEWHMHCHVLNHMTEGMMGTLLVVQGGSLALGLPVGVPCPGMAAPPVPPQPGQATVRVGMNNTLTFNPSDLSVPSGTMVTFDFQTGFHTVTTDSTSGGATAIEVNNGGGPSDGITAPAQRTVTVSGGPGGQINYHCGVHGTTMAGVIHIT